MRAACPMAWSRVTDPSGWPSVAAKPLLVVASASKPISARIRADPRSHGFGSSSGWPGRCRARKRAARSEPSASDVDVTRTILSGLVGAGGPGTGADRDRVPGVDGDDQAQQRGDLVLRELGRDRVV